LSVFVKVFFVRRFSAGDGQSPTFGNNIQSPPSLVQALSRRGGRNYIKDEPQTGQGHADMCRTNLRDQILVSASPCTVMVAKRHERQTGKFHVIGP
jgi:hypothetical protein